MVIYGIRLKISAEIRHLLNTKEIKKPLCTHAVRVLSSVRSGQTHRLCWQLYHELNFYRIEKFETTNRFAKKLNSFFFLNSIDGFANRKKLIKTQEIRERK